jgi:hypothetical protein
LQVLSVATSYIYPCSGSSDSSSSSSSFITNDHEVMCKKICMSWSNWVHLCLTMSKLSARGLVLGLDCKYCRPRKHDHCGTNLTCFCMRGLTIRIISWLLLVHSFLCLFAHICVQPV